MRDRFIIGTFYKFEPLSDLPAMRSRLLEIMSACSVFGTIVLAEEGYNATVSATEDRMDPFLAKFSELVGEIPQCKFSIYTGPAFRRRKVKIKPEIVKLKKRVDLRLASGTHVAPKDWDEIMSDPDTVVIDARNEYEVKVGTFKGALSPGVESFSEIPAYIDSNLSPKEHNAVAMFCTGGIRCEKLAPYLVEKGFSKVFQLHGGILNYLDETKNSSGLWEGECFVFDDRVTVDEALQKGSAADFSSLKQSSQKPPAKRR